MGGIANEKPENPLHNLIQFFSTPTRSQRHVALLVALLTCFYLIFHLGQSDTDLETSTPSASPKLLSTLTSSTLPEARFAYAAFLAAPEKESVSDDDDNYFVATRMLAYQLLHDPFTATNNSIPFIVLVTEEVHERKRRRLEADGATVLQVEPISFPWISPSRNRWRDVLSKLRLWQLTQYERICFLDSDMLIVKPMDGIFEDPAVAVAYNKNKSDKIMADEGLQPSSYVFAGVSGQGGYDHPYPPRTGRAANAGFIVIQPSIEMFNHYMTVAAIEGRFDSKYPEQNLWIYVHRKDGNMPWAQLTTTWNVNWATMKDYKNGVSSLHTKWWDAGPEKDLQDLGWKMRWLMEGSGEARDKLAALGQQR